MSKEANSKKKVWEEFKKAEPETEAKKEPTNKSENQPQDNNANTASAELTGPSIATLEQALQIQEEKNEKLKKEIIYAQATVQNTQRRAKLDIENAYKFSLEKIIKDLLPVCDSLESALTSQHKEKDGEDVSGTLRGVQLTLNQLHQVLKKQGVECVEPKAGDLFDANYHQAMLTEVSGEHAPNTILKVLQKGYLLNKRLIRPALVSVAKAAEGNG